MKLHKKPSVPQKQGRSPFVRKLRERKIIETTAGFIGGGVVLVEFAHHILVNHYHLPYQLVDITLISLVCAWLSVLTWRWFRGGKKIRKIRWELILVPIFLIAGISLDVIQIRNMIREKPQAFEEMRWENSIAVLPFENIGGEEEQQYFCDGLTEELINALSNIEELKVVARTTAFFYKGKQEDIRKIGRELNVKNILEGTVRKSGNQLRITIQLIDVEDGFHIWSSRFDRKLDDVFFIQDEIALAVADHLRIDLLGDEKPRVIKHETENSEAYNLYLLGRFAMNKKTEGGLREAIRQFEQAIEVDLDYALAYTGLADAYWNLSLYGSVPASEVHLNAKNNTMKALAIDNTLAEAHASLANVKIYERDWDGAEKAIQRAIELNPGFAAAHNLYGYHLMCMGRFEEAISALKRAILLDPYGMNNTRNLGRVFYCMGKYDEAISILKGALEINPNLAYTHLSLGLVYMQREKYPEAQEEMEKEKALSAARSPIVDAVSGVIYAHMKDLEKAKEAWVNFSTLRKESYVSPYWLAALAFAVGDKDQGFQLLDEAFTGQDIWLREINVDPLFEDVRKDPRFQDLLERLGLNERES